MLLCLSSPEPSGAALRAPVANSAGLMDYKLADSEDISSTEQGVTAPADAPYEELVFLRPARHRDWLGHDTQAAHRLGSVACCP